MMPQPQDIADFLGRGDDPTVVALAGEALPIITAMARAYTRGNGFDTAGEPNDEVSAVIVTATARLMANPGQLAKDESAGPYSVSVRGGFNGWLLTETFVLNRYRKRAL